MNSELVLILSDTGSGKSTSIGKNEKLEIEGFDPDNTRIINVEGKRLPFPNSAQLYNKEKKNYSEGRNPQTIVDILRKCKDRPEIKNVVIDDFQYILSGMFIDHMNDSDGFKKWNLVLEWVWVLLQECKMLREDQIVFVLCHLEFYNEEGGMLKQRMKTTGKATAKHISPEGLATVVLYSEGKMDGDKITKYFRTQGDSNDTCKCFEKSTEIIMFDGSLKNIENIKEGDLVLGENNKACKVNKLHNGIDELWTVNQSKGINYTVNSNHLLIYNTQQQIRKIETVISTSNKQMYGIKGKLNINLLNNKKILIDPYFLGLWLGDGSKDCTSITTMDKEVVNFINNYSNYLKLRVSIKSKKDNKASTYRISSSSSVYSRKVININTGVEFDSVRKASKEYNIIESSIHHCINGRYKTAGGYKWKKGDIKYNNLLYQKMKNYNLLNNKHIPNDYFICSIENRYKLLAGLLDSDGAKDNVSYYFANSNFDLILDVEKLCNSLGLYTSIKKYNNSYRLYIMGENVINIPLKIQRKKITKLSTIKNYSKTTINSKGEGEYFGFELEGDCKTFFLKDYTVVHNSPFGMFDDLRIKNDLGFVEQRMRKYYGLS